LGKERGYPLVGGRGVRRLTAGAWQSKQLLEISMRDGGNVRWGKSKS